MTPDERAERDAREKDEWIREQLAAAPVLTEESIARLRRVLLPPQRLAS